MNDVIDHLLLTKLCEGLSHDEISRLYPILNARLFRAEKGRILVHPGDEAGFIGVLLNGELAITKEDIYGDSNLIRKVSPHEIFAAEIACTPSQISPLEITCTMESEILTFPYALLSQKSAVPDEFRCTLLKNILDILANNNIRQLYKIELLSKKSLRDRIVLYLAFQVKKCGSEAFEISLTREELATYLCVDRSALSRELGRMQRDGLIRFHKNRFQILTEL